MSHSLTAALPEQFRQGQVWPRQAHAGANPLTLSQRAQSPKNRRPAAADFTPRAVNRAVLAETLQHPLTILPAAAGAVGGLYMGLLGLNPTAFAVTFASALVATGAWVVNYFLRGEGFAERHVEHLQTKRLALREEEVEALAQGWQAAHHTDGIQQVRELRQAYAQLRTFLEKRLAEDGGHGLQLRRLLVLTEDTFREGVAILRQALTLVRALATVDRQGLERELAAWQSEASQSSTRITRIAAHEERLALCAEQEAAIERLLAESEILEAALQKTYLEAAQLGSPEILFARGHTASELERAVQAARRVEDRLRVQDPRTAPGDDIYLQTGREVNHE